MQITKELQEFIEEQIDTIESVDPKKWLKLYEIFEDYDGSELPGEFGELMLKIGVDPSSILGFVPRRFLQFRKDVTNYSIPNNCSYVSMSAFEDANLENIDIPKSVTELDYLCFAGTSLTNVVIPDNVLVIANAVFHSCKSLQEVKILGATSLGWDIFGDCIHLTKVFLNKDIIQIDATNFYGCTRLKTIDFEGTVEEFKLRKHETPEADLTVKCSDGEYIWSSKFVDEE